MPYPNIFTKEVSDEIIKRINNLTAETQPKWGKMNSSQMLAHCNVVYEMIYSDIHPKPNAFMKFIMKTLIKKKVVGETDFPHNSRTAPQFVISDTKNFVSEKQRLIDYINKTLNLGAEHFDQLESSSFGPLNITEWNNLMYKHLDHHLKQFGV